MLSCVGWPKYGLPAPKSSTFPPAPPLAEKHPLGSPKNCPTRIASTRGGLLRPIIVQHVLLQDGKHHLFSISFMRGRTSTLRGKEHQETEDHDHELSPRLDRKENGEQLFSLPQGEKNLPKKRVDHPQGGLDWWAVCVFLWCVGNVEMID